MLRTTIGWWCRIGVFSLAVAVTGVPAFAQEPAQQEPQPSQERKDASKEEQQATTEQKPVVLKEIVVTAQKREENVQNVPLAVSTINREDFNAISAGAPDVRILSARVPSLILESSFGRAFPRFYIRGLGNTDFDLNASQPVSMLVDEVVLENPIVKGMPLFDIDRIEVLRGPQGTLFGRNTPAGVVKIETRKPSQTFDANLRASFGSFDTVDISGAVGGPLSETVSARFSGLYQSQSDWIDNVHTGKNDAYGGFETTAFRAQLLWQPTDTFKALFSLNRWEISNGTARIFRANIIEKGSNTIVPDFDFDKVYFDGLNTQEMSSLGGFVRLDWDMGAATLTSITGYESINDMYSRGDIDGGFGDASHPPYGPGFIPFYSESADGIPNLDQWTQELRVASNDAEVVDWLVGAFYFDEDFRADTYSYTSVAPGNPQEGFAFQTQKAKSYALFGSLTYHLSQMWDLSAGLRYTKDKKDFAAERPQPVFQTPTIAPITKHTDADNVSWDLSATYKLSPDVNIYGRVATGFRAPSIQGRILFAPDFEGGTNPATNGVSVADEETILSLETGFKSILAERTLRLNMTAYWFQVDGQQLTAVGGEYNVATLLNADTTEGHGIEADIEWTPTGNWLMTFGASWNPTKIKDKNLTVAPCGGGCTVTDPLNADGLALIDGNPLPNAPKIILNGIVNWRSDPATKAFFGTLDFAYYSDKNFMLYESKEFHDDSFEVGLRLGYAWNQARYEVALFARNLLDAKILRGGIDFDNLTGFTNEPRTVGLEFVAHF
jgi:iron complex outermembrane recepter protein